jgi:hypothetical protein
MAPRFIKDNNNKDDIYEIQKELKDLDNRNTKLYKYMSTRLDRLDKLVEECINLQTQIIRQEKPTEDKPSIKQFIMYTIFYTLLSFVLTLIITDSNNPKIDIISYFTSYFNR